MAMTLSSTTSAAKAETKHSIGTDEFTMAAGQSLKIETSPNGEDVLDVEVPAGKSWTVIVDVSIREVSA